MKGNSYILRWCKSLQHESYFKNIYLYFYSQIVYMIPRRERLHYSMETFFYPEIDVSELFIRI